MPREDRDTTKRSKYGRSYGGKRPIGEKRVRYFPGSGEDAKRYYRCWNCGFPIDSKREIAGDGGDIGFKEHHPSGLADRVGGSSVYTFEIVGWRESGINLLYADGVTPQPVNPVYSTVPTGGCPFCGTKNWK